MPVEAWAPGHATLFFAVPSKFEEINQKGSIGAGFNFDTGVLTRIQKAGHDSVFWNNVEIDGKVTLSALQRYREITGFNEKVKIEHHSELKIGHGLSTSGAGALGTVLALNRLFESGLNKEFMYQIAHFADVVNHTGLGSVMGQITKGIEIRTSQGGPGIGKTRSIKSDREVVLLMIDKLKTSDVLVSEEQMNKVNSAGLNLTNSLQNIEENFEEKIILLGKQFARSCGLMTTRVKKTIEDLENMGETNVSMAMIGETIVILPKDTSKVVEYGFNQRIDTVVTKISDKLPYVIDLNHRN